jgi:hypothetical protein
MALHETTPEAPMKGESGARVLLHEKQDSPVLLARTHSMSAELGWSREVKLELRKVFYYNFSIRMHNFNF